MRYANSRLAGHNAKELNEDDNAYVGLTCTFRSHDVCPVHTFLRTCHRSARSLCRVRAFHPEHSSRLHIPVKITKLIYVKVYTLSGR